MSHQGRELTYEEKLRALHNHVLQLNSATSRDEVARCTLDAMEFILGFDLADISLVENGFLRMIGYRGQEQIGDMPLDGRGVAVKVVNSKTAKRIRDTRNEPDYVYSRKMGKSLRMLSELAVPVVVDKEAVAVLNVENNLLDAFTAEDQQLLESLAGHVAMALGRINREEKLRESEKRYRSLVDRMLDGVYQSTHEGRFVDVNPAFVKMFGYASKQEMLDIPDIRKQLYFSPEDRGSNILDGGQEKTETFRMRRKDGSEIWVEDHGRHVHDDKGKVVYHEGILRDVTERRRMEEEIKRYSEHLERLVEERTEELQSAKKRLEYVVSLNPAVIFVCKPLPDLSDYYTTYISDSVVSTVGFNADEFMGENGNKLWESRVHPDDLASYRGGMSNFWREGHRVYEYRFRHKDGAYRWLHEEARLIRDANEKPLEIIGYSANVTRMKAMEQRLEQAEHLAGIGEAATMVGHDLRNPLQGIASAVYVLRTQPLEAKERDEMLETIQKCVDYSDGIVNDLLDYARTFELSCAETSPKRLVASALESIQIPNMIKVKNESSEQSVISVDQARMKRVIVNLIENAIDAMPNGGTLSFSSIESNGLVKLVVSDTGAGLPKEVLENLWKPLQTTKPKGMGLGLPICKRIVDAHGGEIAVKSKQGEGTTITIRLPTTS
ncbi:MAG TPA: PAS domain S-box protein [Candidatus Acidoferrales bacterium]|nr:PAS domain S-box protein [Candidatus Acidoferrales bacterium]